MTKTMFTRWLLALGAVAILLVVMGRYTHIDVWLADLTYDFDAGNFPLRDNWFAAVLMHRWMKYLFIAGGMIPVALLVFDSAQGRTFLHPAQREWIMAVALSFVLVPLTIDVLKSESIYACPWDLQRYGGSLPLLRLFDALPPATDAGHCFPAGHAAVALWLPALAVRWMPRNETKSCMVFMAGLLPGLLLGLVQQLRGAHFLTHTLWSMWIASLIIVCIARVLFLLPHRYPARAARSSTSI